MLNLTIFKLKPLFVKTEDKLELQLLFIILQTLTNFIKKAKKKEKKEKKKEKKKKKSLKKQEIMKIRLYHSFICLLNLILKKLTKLKMAFNQYLIRFIFFLLI